MEYPVIEFDINWTMVTFLAKFGPTTTDLHVTSAITTQTGG
jgi:hypothetical protein